MELSSFPVVEGGEVVSDFLVVESGDEEGVSDFSGGRW